MASPALVSPWVESAVQYPTSRRHAFTLIELLIVIAIIAALAALLLPAIQSSLHKAEKVRAQEDVKRLVSAWTKYWQEYGQWLFIEKKVLQRTEPARFPVSRRGSMAVR